MLLPILAALSLAHVLAPPMRPVLLRARQLIATQPDAPDFDDTLRGILASAKTGGSMAAAVDSWLEGLDDTFIPELGARIADTEPSSAELPRMNDLMTELQGRGRRAAAAHSRRRL